MKTKFDAVATAKSLMKMSSSKRFVATCDLTKAECRAIVKAYREGKWDGRNAMDVYVAVRGRTCKDPMKF